MNPAKEMYDHLQKAIADSPKTSWGKNEIRLFLTEAAFDYFQKKSEELLEVMKNAARQ